MSDTQKRILKEVSKLLAAAIVGIIAFINTVGQPAEEHERILRETCARQDLELLVEFSDTALCTHGPDPKPALAPITAEAGVTPVAPDKLCTETTAGPRVKVYLAHPSDKPPTDMAKDTAGVLRTIGITERQLYLSHTKYRQGIRWLCSNGKPSVTPLPVIPPFDGMEDAIAALPGEGAAQTVHLFIARNSSFPYCGVGTIMGTPQSKAQGNDGLGDYGDRGWALIDPDCQGTGGTTLHELLHTFGAVQSSAPHSGGNGWHGYQDQDVMSYNDGSEWYGCTSPFDVSGCGKTKQDCPSAPAFFVDCSKDDYWSPIRPTAGYFATHWNTADSPYMTVPRLK